MPRKRTMQLSLSLSQTGSHDQFKEPIMSLWSDYIKECGLLEIIEDETGWITFHIEPGGCLFINDMYVAPEERRKGRGSHLLDQACAWGRERSCIYVSATLHTSSKAITETLKGALACGFYVAPSGNKDLILVGKAL